MILDFVQDAEGNEVPLNAWERQVWLRLQAYNQFMEVYSPAGMWPMKLEQAALKRGLEWKVFKELLGEPCLHCLTMDSRVMRTVRDRVDSLPCQICGCVIHKNLVSTKRFDSQICYDCDKA